jgi:hypothetical protein
MLLKKCLQTVGVAKVIGEADAGGNRQILALFRGEAFQEKQQLFAKQRISMMDYLLHRDIRD